MCGLFMTDTLYGATRQADAGAQGCSLQCDLENTKQFKCLLNTLQHTLAV